MPGPVHANKPSRQIRGVHANVQPIGQPKRRLRWSNLPKPGSGEVPYAKSRPELAGFSEGQIARAILDSAAWKEVMRPVLDQLDRERVRPGKEKPFYSSEELESVLLYQRVCGLGSYKRARNELAGDREEARRLLGFDKPRNRKSRVVKLRDGVPSEATMSRHRGRFVERRRVEAYLTLERRLLDEHLSCLELQEEARILNLDGTKIQTHYTAPIVDPKTKRTVNDAQVTAPEAGYVPHSAGPDHSGHGWNLVSITSTTGIPLAWKVVPLNASEKDVAIELVRDEFEPRVASRVPRELTVLSADGGFAKQELRAELRRLGIVENIHLVSHGDAPESHSNAKKNNAKHVPIEGYKSWFTNGHRELSCACGAGTSIKRLSLDRNGKAVVRTEGACRKCGSITITSGDWRKAQNPDRWVRINPQNSREKPDLLMGNPLTFNDPISGEYGRRRFGHNEGFHGALVSRFGLIKDKRWFRRLDEAKIATAMTFCVMHVVALEQRRRRAEAEADQAQAPPGLAA